MSHVEGHAILPFVTQYDFSVSTHVTSLFMVLSDDEMLRPTRSVIAAICSIILYSVHVEAEIP